MENKYILQVCTAINLFFLLFLVGCFFIFDDHTSNYFRIGWHKDFVFVSITIDNPLKYFLLIIFISILNITEIFLNDLAFPIINFSTYNPYKTEIHDFTRLELEMYSNVLYFIIGAKRLFQIATAVTQIDLAIITLLSSQVSIYFVIKYFLDKKRFISNNQYIEVPTNYGSINSSYQVHTQSNNEYQSNNIYNI